MDLIIPESDKKYRVSGDGPEGIFVRPKLSYLFMGLCFFVIFGAGPVSVIMSGGTVR